MPLSWDKLLDSVRIRSIFDGKISDPEHRTPFQQDFDRVIFSSPVRRLQDKAQVFPLDPSDAVRTRLTHSLEVSSLARGIVLKIADILGPDHEFSRLKSNIVDIASTAGLVHDLGNPPFGHFGEDAIREWFAEGTGLKSLEALAPYPQMQCDISKYEGNARTIRLLCSLQILADRYGLNLTAATLAASMKYVASSNDLADSKVDHTKSKPGYCWWEQPVIDQIRQRMELGQSRHPISFIVEAADDGVYSLCDLEDAVRKGILTWDELCVALCKQEPDDARKAELGKWLDDTRARIDKRFEDSKFKPSPRVEDETRAVWFRTQGHGVIVEGAARSFVEHYSEIMDCTYKGELVLDKQCAPSAAQLVDCSKKAAQQYVYPVRQNLELELKGRRVIHDLMDLLWKGISAYNGSPPKSKTTAGKAWGLLSENYRTLFEVEWNRSQEISAKHGVDIVILRQYLRLLLLTDYIGGMTDSFACTLHRSLNNG